MFGINVSNLNFRTKIRSVKQPIQNNSRLMKRDQYWLDRDWCAWLEYVSACLVVFLPTSFSAALLHLLVLLVWWRMKYFNH